MGMNTQFQIGDIRIDRIVELECSIRPAKVFFPDITPAMLDENRSWLQPRALDANDWIVLCFQSYIVRTPHHTILVDSCIGNDRQGRAQPLFNGRSGDVFMKSLAAAGLSVDDIDVVMCTHLHADHVGWNTRLENGRWVPTFPNARYLFSETEFKFWSERNAIQPAAHFVDSVLPIVDANRHSFVRSSDAVDDHVRLLPTPGHTPDHFCVVFGRGHDAGVITGDAIHSPLQARYPELWMHYDVEPAKASRTRRAFLERYCDTETVCCTAHFPSPSLTRIRRWDSGFRCEAVEA
jgi:glyoxylase-like metal-dependent hydrolase (beta-lactamase superfamily II)